MGEEHHEQPRPSDLAGASGKAAGGAVDPCGCLPSPDREESPTPEPDEQAETHQKHDQPADGGARDEQPPAEAPGRALKLVLHLQPTRAAGYRALLALGADGCDPVLRLAEVANLASALDEIPGLVAEAEARWQTRPRYPASAKARSAATTSRPKAAPPAVASEAKEPAADASTTKPAAEASPKAAPAGQLSLFG